ncbi:conserved hypothetical protein [Ricinus communis]|uniref:Uncharacterized protein n=1 Tax=Ricinus communis TaxID=3988 RepID=B9RJM2_RICCO|nr:conserved hypothetical protein [Ricinus communis]
MDEQIQLAGLTLRVGLDEAPGKRRQKLRDPWHTHIELVKLEREVDFAVPNRHPIQLYQSKASYPTTVKKQKGQPAGLVLNSFLPF